MKTAKGMMALAGMALGLLVPVGLASAADSARKKDAQARDVQIEQKVDAQLQEDVRLARQRINAGVKKGVVTLMGTVDTEADKSRAEQIARSSGATKVDNRLAVVESSEVGDDSNRKLTPTAEPDHAATKPVDESGSTTGDRTETLKEKSEADREKSELPPLQQQPQKPPLRDTSSPQPF